MAAADKKAEQEIEETEQRMQKEESEAKENKQREEHVEELEEEAKQELDQEGQEVKKEGKNEKKGEDPETSVKHHKEIISEEEHTEKLLREVFDEIDEEVKEEIDEEQLLTNNVEELGRAANEVLQDLKQIYDNIRDRQTNDVKDRELKQLEDLIGELGEAIKQEERGLKELEALEEQVRHTEVEEERALELVNEAVNEEEKEKQEIKYEGKRAENQNDQKAEEYLEKEFKEENQLEQKNESLATAITSEVNVELVNFAKDLRHELKELDGYLESVDNDTEKVLSALDEELAECQRESGGDKKKRIKKVRSDIEDFGASAEKELQKQEKIIEKEEKETNQVVKEGEKISDFKVDFVQTGGITKFFVYGVGLFIVVILLLSFF